MSKLPEDCSARAICTRSRGIFAYQIDSNKWEWHEQTGTDHGTDIVLELSDGECFSGKKIEGQLKGRTQIEFLKSGKIKFDLEVKTTNYALNNSNPFVLFLIDVTEEKVYYLAIQDYFIENPERFGAAKNNAYSVTLHIDPENTLDGKPDELISIANRVYAGGPSVGLRRCD